MAPLFNLFQEEHNQLGTARYRTCAANISNNNTVQLRGFFYLHGNISLCNGYKLEATVTLCTSLKYVRTHEPQWIGNLNFYWNVLDNILWKTGKVKYLNAISDKQLLKKVKCVYFVLLHLWVISKWMSVYWSRSIVNLQLVFDNAFIAHGTRK